MPQLIRLHRLGTIPYNDAWDWQRRTAGAVREGAPEALALLQHPHVYTFGRRVHPENLLVPPADAGVVASDRGGDVTYHGPGQLVAYPILNLHQRNLGAADYVRLLEEVMIGTAAAFHVEAHRIPGRPGVWTPQPIASHRAAARGEATSAQPPDASTRFEPLAKLGAIGVRVQRGVTTHGLALNVAPDLGRFDAIVPCGLKGIAVTSLAHQLGHPINIDDAEHALITAFEAVFNCHLEAAPTQSSQGFVVHSPSLNVGEGRAAAGVRFNAPSLQNVTESQTAVPHGR